MNVKHTLGLAVAITLTASAASADSNEDLGAVIETMGGTVEHVDLETHQVVVADFVYRTEPTVVVKRGGASYIGLKHLQVGDRVVLHMPPNQHWELPMPVAEIEIKR